MTTWVKPQLVAEVKFTEWTSSGEMRHPVYLGLREDKRAENIVIKREKQRMTRAPHDEATTGERMPRAALNFARFGCLADQRIRSKGNLAPTGNLGTRNCIRAAG